AFSAKAVDHFKGLSRKGKTVLFVSHSLPVMEQMCNRAIWIEGGRICADGSPRTVCAQYQNRMSESPEIVYDLAESGVPEAQYRLALMYRDGDGMPRDPEKYEEWARRASEQGNVQAQVEYAEILLRKDPKSEEAVSLYRLAAEGGNNTARLKLSMMLGSDTDRERAEVLEVFRRLAEKGNAFDCYRYADLLLKSAWTDDDRKEAFGWFSKAAEGGNADAMYQAAIMCRDGNGTPRDIPRMMGFLEKAGEEGHFNALHMLVDVYTAGKLVESDDRALFRWCLRSARIGNPRSQYLVATMYREGRGVEKDPGQADMWLDTFAHSAIALHQMQAAEALRNIDIGMDVTPEEMLTKAARSRNMSTRYALMSAYRDGLLEIPDRDIALETAEGMSEQYGINRTYLADSLYKGNICPQDKPRAAELYRSCAANGDGTAAYRLALMYINGDGVEKDRDLGMKYLEFAVERSNKDAAVLMNRMCSKRRQD
ncbi:MAG: hypothetical protein MJZ68_08875, partial [archaeon]|nr:hypothetical protein [archaeon]